MIIIQALYFFLPAYFANMAPVFADASNLPFGDPVHSRFFGKHKTWRGFVAAYVLAFLVLYIQKFLLVHHNPVFSKISILDYTNCSIFLYAFGFGIGAMTGDLVKSFFKRRFDIAPGAPWFPFDQLDFVFGAIIFLYPFLKIPLPIIIVLLIVTPFLHFAANVIGYFLGLKKVWW